MMIPSVVDDDGPFQESFQTNAELLASSEHESAFDRILGPSQKQIMEEIIRLFLFVIFLRWREEPARLSNETNKTTNNNDPVSHTTTTSSL
jgi:hypothetical protein